MATAPRRRDARWLVLGPMLAMAGYALGFALVWASVLYVFSDSGYVPISWPRYLVGSMVLGISLAVDSLVVGLVVGLVLTFLVGDTRSPRARRTAMIAAGATCALVTALLFLLGFLGAAQVSWPVLTVVAALIAGWLHDRLVSRGGDAARAH